MHLHSSENEQSFKELLNWTWGGGLPVKTELCKTDTRKYKSSLGSLVTSHECVSKLKIKNGLGYSSVCRSWIQTPEERRERGERGREEVRRGEGRGGRQEKLS